MIEFLEQLGFKEITSDDYFKMVHSLDGYIASNKPYHAFYRRAADNGIITYIMHGTEAGLEYIAIISKYGIKWVHAYQYAPHEYIKDITLDLITRSETTVLKLGTKNDTEVQLKNLRDLEYL